MTATGAKGKAISRSKIHAEIQYAVDKLKMRGLLPQDAVIAMHSARKTVAAIAHAHGEDLEVISKMLGHRSTEHTRAYLGITSQSGRTTNEVFNDKRGTRMKRLIVLTLASIASPAHGDHFNTDRRTGDRQREDLHIQKR
jgi:integrase